ncbi:MAG: WYL domain-containing transcriptional regulator [Candidatus Coatesbacteria bacterium]
MARQWRIVRALEASPEGLGYRELGRILGAAQRTVYRDLGTLRSAGFPVARASAHGKPVWKLAPGSSSTQGSSSSPGTGAVPSLTFTRAELTALSLARQMLMAMPGGPFDAAARGAFHKIQAACDREGLRVLELADKRLYADLRRARPYTDRDVWFRELLEAIHRSETVRLKYWTMERETETLREADPYGMVYHEGAFYLVAWCHWRRDVRTFLVDRIRAVTGTGRFFTAPEGFSVREHFRDAWGLIKTRALERVRIRFARSAARIVAEGRWHASQRLEREADGSAVLEVRVAGWTELRRWVLSFGGDAEVLEPADLRASVAAEAARLGRRYAKVRAS